MGRKYIKKSDVVKINAYMSLANARITSMGDYWEVSTPKETFYYEETGDMMHDIDKELKKLKKRIDPQEYKAALNNDGRLNV